MAIASVVTVSGVYVSTPRDTSPNPSFYEYIDVDPGTPIYSNDNFKYYLNDDTDVITVYDIRNGYTWKTGLDIPFTTDMRKECKTFERTFGNQFKNVPIDDDTFDQYEAISSNVSEYVDTELVTYYGVLEFDTDGLANEYDNEGVMVPATKEDIQLVFEDLNLVAGTTYQITFWIEMDAVRDYEVLLGSELAETVTSDGSGEFVEVIIQHTQTTTETGDLVFNFGYFDTMTEYEADIKLDSVFVQEFDGVEVVADSDILIVGDFDMDESKYEISIDELLEICQPAEERMNEYFTAFANSLVTFEYYDQTNALIYASSAAKDNETTAQVVESTFMRENGDDSTWALNVSFKNDQFDIQAIVHITFTESGIEYDVFNDEITGTGRENLASVIIAPFQGASGGAYKQYDITDIYDTDYDNKVTFKDAVPGYILVPDGSGALIRYNDYNVKLDKLRIDTYGENPLQEYYFESVENEYIKFKTLSLPLFGMAHGDNQAGFVAYATQGDEYMSVNVWPEENITYYTNAFARFQYNTLYFQVYNKAGQGNTSLSTEPNDFDVHMVYEYLDGTNTEGERADYVGMAMKYREYLFGDEINSYDYSDIPIRLDFLMSDS
jgi:hypothetical protein